MAICIKTIGNVHAKTGIIHYHPKLRLLEKGGKIKGLVHLCNNPPLPYNNLKPI